MEDHEDEFRAHWGTLNNKTLPAYSQVNGTSYTTQAEGYYNYIPVGIKDSKPDLKTLYGNLVHVIKPSYGLPAVENPKQLPPPIIIKNKDGTKTIRY